MNAPLQSYTNLSPEIENNFLTMTNEIKSLIVESVDFTMRELFPKKYFSLCHAYAIVGSNVASIVLGREFRPVAGMAIIDCGAGKFIKLLDNKAFSSGIGGAYHCWIESIPRTGEDKELVDITFKHNSSYAKKNKIAWRKKASTFLWGPFKNLVVEADPNCLPSSFPEGTVWLRETPEGFEWMNRQIISNMDLYAKATALAINKLNHAKNHEA